MRNTECFDKDGDEIHEGNILENSIGEVFTVYFSKGSFFLHNRAEKDDYNDIAMYMCKTFPKIIGKELSR